MKAKPTAAGPTLDVAKKAGAAWLVLSRPEALNAINDDMVDGLGNAFDNIEADDEVRVVVLTGTGRAFCAGADLRDAKSNAESDGGGEASERFLDRVQALMHRIESFPKPTICAINGLTLGAGLELALCCDIIVASARARIGDGHAKFGLLPGGGSSARLPRRISTAAAKLVMFTADLYTAEELREWGLIQRVYEEADFGDSVQLLCERIGSRSPLAVARMKELVDKTTSRSCAEALAAEREMMRLHRGSYDRAEGLAAFAEKREPRFLGR